MRKRHPVQNLYSSQLDAAVQAIGSTGDRLDIFKINVVTPPSTDSGWIFLDFENPDKRDLIFYHSKTGNELSYYRMNRDLLGNGANNVTHTKGASVRMNDVGEWMNYMSQNVEDFGTIEQWGDGLNVIKVYGGKIAYNMTTVTVPDTILTLADGTWHIVYDYVTGSITNVSTITNPGLWVATVVVASSTISSIVDVRGTAQATAFSSTFFDVASGTLIIAAGSIGTAQIADNSITDAKLTNSGTPAGTYGDANNYPVVTVNAKGRVTNMSTLPLPTLLYAYVHTQGVAATTWNINHNLNTTDLVFAVFDATDAAIVPDTFVIVDANNVTITFTGAIDGKAVLTVVGGSLAGAPARGDIVGTLSDQLDLQAALNAKQPLLVSGTNIKTINGATLLGAGDIVISGSANTAWIEDFVGDGVTTIFTLANLPASDAFVWVSGNGVFSQDGVALDYTVSGLNVTFNTAPTLGYKVQIHYIQSLGTAVSDPMTTIGDMIYRNGSNTTTRLPVGGANRALVSNGTIPGYGAFIKVGTTAAMAGTSLVHADADATTTSVVNWTASSTPNGFIEVVLTAGNITFNSTVAETCSFTYTLIKA